ncbi:hypothetical protein A8C32_17745 [Flavivirga aquatica]|uniref:Lipocalin-like domain-containing protein n=1 Tax=Flavivirga aquatica TaxID=1849968 RepID=A0A1E5T7C5_9FLAO|nr:hypothetical protein [Flavivirga aquatica]OEK07282.1 hypothetical protein A8C32_17745 [Flavivirga aquatica]
MKTFKILNLIIASLILVISSCSSDDDSNSDENNSTDCGYKTIISNTYSQIPVTGTTINVNDIPDRNLPVTFQIVETTTEKELFGTDGQIRNDNGNTYYKIKVLNIDSATNTVDLMTLNDSDYEITYHSERSASDCLLSIPSTNNGGSFMVNYFDLVQCQGAGKNYLEIVDNGNTIDITHHCGLIDTSDGGTETVTYYKMN